MSQPRPSFRDESVGFESSLDAYVQQRLRLASLALFVLGAVVAGTIAVLALTVDRGAVDGGLPSWFPVVLAFVVLILVLHLALRLRRLPRVGLTAADVSLSVASTGLCVGVYALGYRTGVVVVPAFLAILNLARAIVVPCPARRTLLLTLPAAPVILAVQLVHGEGFAFVDEGVSVALPAGAAVGRIVNEDGRQEPGRVVSILVQACEALHEAHSRGLVHRDVKEGNLFLCEQGLVPDVVKVMDFGLVKVARTADPDLTSAGEILGSPRTMVPEQITAGEIGPWTDIYTLGAVGCFLVAGRPAFDAVTALEFVAQHLHNEPVSPSERGVEVPEDLERILLQCLRKEPRERPESVVALRTALLACDCAGRWTEADAAEWWGRWRRRGGGGSVSGPDAKTSWRAV